MPDFGLSGGASAAGAPVESPPAFNATDFSLDPLPPVGAEPDIFKTAGATPTGGSKTTDFNLDLKDLNLELGGQRAPAAAAKDDHWYDVQQKFDLAKAYEEMGDKDGAREILNEVLKEGDPEQQAQARKLLGPRG
jgi:pilus assembly protein FimV